MQRTLVWLPAALLLAGCAGGTSPSASPPEANMAHVHMGHVLTSWKDTPEHKGFLPTAQAEAEIAAQHAGFAASRPDDLAWMKMHIGHVMNAIDPSVEPAGPGLGYGVKRAATGVAQHVGFAAASEGASDNVKLHAGHVAASSGDVVEWSDQIIALGREVESADSAAAAAPKVLEIQALTQAVLAGLDANGDGQVTWMKGEGGLAQAAQHMEFMKQGEGLS